MSSQLITRWPLSFRTVRLSCLDHNRGKLQFVRPEITASVPLCHNVVPHQLVVLNAKKKRKKKCVFSHLFMEINLLWIYLGKPRTGYLLRSKGLAEPSVGQRALGHERGGRSGAADHPLPLARDGAATICPWAHLGKACSFLYEAGTSS